MAGAVGDSMNSATVTTTSESESSEQRMEEERKKVAQSEFQLPPEIRQRFQTIGFGGWGRRKGKSTPCDWFPVLEIGPDGLDEGPLLQEWRKYYKRFSDGKRSTMPHLVYWYGVPIDRASEAFAFLEASSFMSYDEGVKLGLEKLPKAISDKIKKGDKLSIKEQDLWKGLEDFHEAVQLPKESRITFPRTNTEYGSTDHYQSDTDEEEEGVSSTDEEDESSTEEEMETDTEEDDEVMENVDNIASPTTPVYDFSLLPLLHPTVVSPTRLRAAAASRQLRMLDKKEKVPNIYIKDDELGLAFRPSNA